LCICNNTFEPVNEQKDYISRDDELGTKATAAIPTKTRDRVRLKRSIPFTNQLDKENTTYIIKNEFDLGGKQKDLRINSDSPYIVINFGEGVKQTYYYSTVDLKAGNSIHVDNSCVIINPFGIGTWDKLIGKRIRAIKDTTIFIGSQNYGDYTYYENPIVRIPRGCILKFRGGSLKNGTIVGQNTIIEAKKRTILSNVFIDGDWCCEHIYSKWFSDVSENNRLAEVFNLSNDSVYNVIEIENEDYRFLFSYDAEIGVRIKSNSNIQFNGNVILAPNNHLHYSILGIEDAQNIRLIGEGHIIGDIENHTGVAGEHGHCLAILKSSNVYIKDLTFERGWGDGIEIAGPAESSYGEDKNASKNITLENITCDSNRRQGLSLTHCRNITITNSRFINTGLIKYTTPGYGIDIEPTSNDEYKHSVKNVYLNNCVFYGNRNAAIGIQQYSDNADYCKDVFITNCSLGGQRLALHAVKDIKVDNCHGIGVIYLFNASQNSTNRIITNSTISSIELRENGYGYLDIDHCTLGGDAVETIVRKYSNRIQDRISITNSNISFLKNLTIPDVIFYNTEIRNSRIIQIAQDPPCNSVFAGTKCIDCYIEAYQIYPQGNPTEFTNCEINCSADKVFFVYNLDKLILKNNYYLNEAAQLLDVGYGNFNSLYFEGEIVPSVDNISSMSSLIKTVVNKAEVYKQ